MLTLQNLVHYFIAIFHLIYTVIFMKTFRFSFFIAFDERYLVVSKTPQPPRGLLKHIAPLTSERLMELLLRSDSSLSLKVWEFPQENSIWQPSAPFPLTPWIFEIIAGHILSKREQGGSVSLYFGAILQMKEEIHWKEKKWMQL